MEEGWTKLILLLSLSCFNMADGSYNPSIIQKRYGQSHLFSRVSPNLHSRYSGIRNLSGVAYMNGVFQAPVLHHTSGIHGLAPASPLSPVCIQAPSEKGVAGFFVDFLMGGVSAVISKIASAPIERVKLLIQNQNEMIKVGRLSEPYKGIGDCFGRTVKDEGFISLWRGNTANLFHYFPTQLVH